jgi:hypothetical protein
MDYLGVAMFPAIKTSEALLVVGLSYDRFQTMTHEELQKYRRDLIKLSHPDRPENQGKRVDLGAINAAFDVLKQSGTLALNASYRSSIAPPWQPDKRSNNNRIQVESYRDQNYLKKTMWELSGKSDEIFVLDAFGRQNFEGRTRVYGSAQIFDEMAQAMLVWNANGGKIGATRAVFASSIRAPDTLNLIYADGRSHARRPIPLKYNQAAGSPYNDKVLVERLPVILDRVGEMLAA